MGKELIGSLELNRIYQRDCLEGMRMLPDKSVNLIVIDPPYNIGKDKRWDKYKAEDYLEFMTTVFKECERVLMDNGSFYWFHNDFEQISDLHTSINDNTTFVFKQFLVWNKRFDGASNKGFMDGFIEPEGLRNYQKMTEYCLFYTFQDETGLTRVKHSLDNFATLRNYFRDFQKALGMTKKAIIESVGQRADHCFRWSSSQWDLPTPETYEAISGLPRDNSFVIRKYEELRMEYEELRMEYEELRMEYEELRYTFNNQKTHHSVWNYEVAPKLGHVTPKPLDLIENIIRHSSNPGDIILDCFMGSGTTAVASVRTRRKFIGFEREPEYIEIANKRLDNEVSV
jgi:site-specific DNA-methyltransferase (adenine-specific)